MGEFADLSESIDAMVAGAGELVGSVDPMDAEMVGATVLALAAYDEDEQAVELLGLLVEQFAARVNPEALTLLLGIEAVADPPVSDRANDAARRLVRSGIPEPGWAAGLRAPVTVGACWRAADSAETDSVLVGTFHRAGRSHTLAVTVDHAHCGAADEIFLMDADQVATALEATSATGGGPRLTREPLEPAEFRRLVENALDARAVHDGPLLDDDGWSVADEEPDELDPDEEGPDYPVLATLLRARLRTLPESGRPPAPHENTEPLPSPLDLLVRLMNGTALHGLSLPIDLPGPRWVEELPPKRRKKDGPAPVYQIKVSLRGARPPIWRRLEVPADISLAGLHGVIQVAFGWGGGHLHVFETPFGEFGPEDAELGHRPDAEVTLEQVAAEVKSKVRYTYDFGDDWQHDILVEKVLDPAGRVPGPVCTGGRRAGPPEDCGGMNGYAELIDVLGDPDDAEHPGMLDWLGLADARDFDPANFDAREVTRRLTRAS